MITTAHSNRLTPTMRGVRNGGTPDFPIPYEVDPTNISPRSRPDDRLLPIRELMAAILDDAIDELALLRSGTRPSNCSPGMWRARRIRLEDWFKASDDWLFGFARICELLGLDASAVRTRVLNGRTSPR